MNVPSVAGLFRPKLVRVITVIYFWKSGKWSSIVCASSAIVVVEIKLNKLNRTRLYNNVKVKNVDNIAAAVALTHNQERHI